MSNYDRRLLTTPPRKGGDASAPVIDSPPAKLLTPGKDHQAFVLTDPVAFAYLESDPSTTVLERNARLTGYECYIVEQWAVSRINPTFMITTYTGDPQHVVRADVLGVPSDEKTWSQRLRVFFKALNQHHARRESTPLGMLIITSLSGFPSTLTVIPMPGGDLRKHRADFFVNMNLKRLGCLGRIGMTLGPAPLTAIAKFHQMYHTAEKNDANQSVVELVRMCQLALYLFGKLDIDFADGLLCDMTERAISAWWNDIGTEHYSSEPHDGPLGPTTIAALIGLLMGVKNRLRNLGAGVPKDAFDMDGMKRSIASFQRQQRLPKSRRLDRATLSLLVKATAKAAAGEGWAVPQAVKSTVAELSGRGGEMLNDVVRKKDRAGIAEVETTNYDDFILLVSGPRARWLWYGKAIKRHRQDQHFTSNRGTPGRDHDPRTPEADSDTDTGLHKTFKHRASGLRNEAKSGLGRIKDAVHLRPRQNGSPRQATVRTSREEPSRSDYSSPGSPFNAPISPISPIHERMPEFSLTVAHQPRPDQHSSEHSRNQSPHMRQVPKLIIPAQAYIESESDESETEEHIEVDEALPGKEQHARLNVDLGNLELPTGASDDQTIGPALRRTASEQHAPHMGSPTQRPQLYAKHLSFTLAEDTVLPWTQLSYDSSSSLDERATYAAETYRAERQKLLRAAIADLQVHSTQMTQDQLHTLTKLVDQKLVDKEAAEQAYQSRSGDMQALTSDVDSTVRQERERFEDSSRELETLQARLNYEIDGLKGRIEDVDNVVDDFESAVLRVEDRVLELEKSGNRQQDWGCRVM